jgi:hypothetical protein
MSSTGMLATAWQKARHARGIGEPAHQLDLALGDELVDQPVDDPADLGLVVGDGLPREVPVPRMPQQLRASSVDQLVMAANMPGS